MGSFVAKRFSSFTYLNVTQFLGALNDNIYKLLVIYFLIQLQGLDESPFILATTGAIFVLPFLLFSVFSGTLADCCSKRNIIVWTKLLEVVIMLFAFVAFYYKSPFGAYAMLFMLATQSALFGPSKYGIIPELVAEEKITKANGLMTSFTFLAIILGTFIASFLVDITGRNFLFASSFCLVVAIIGFFASLYIERTPPAGERKKIHPIFLYEIYQTLKRIKEEPSLLMAVVGSSYFLFLGAYIQLNMIPFAVQSLGLTDVQGGYLFFVTALGIGLGCVIAGKVSGKSAELGLVPIAGVGVTICCYLLDAYGTSLFATLPLIFSLGLLGGVYVIPLDSYIQIASPNQIRGQVVAAANFLSFVGVLLASLLLYFATEVFDLQADKGFTIVGTLTLIMVLFIGYQFFDYLTRFIGMLFSRLHFNTKCIGEENIPATPAIYICTHTAWNDTLLLLGTQRLRMRFFIEQEQDHKRWLKRIYKMLRVVLIPSIEPLENNSDCLAKIRKTLKKGISVCIFVENPNLSQELEKLKSSYSFQEILEETGYPMIPVMIDKGSKEVPARFFTRTLNKFRVPAAIFFGFTTKKKKTV